MTSTRENRQLPPGGATLTPRRRGLRRHQTFAITFLAACAHLPNPDRALLAADSPGATPREVGLAALAELDRGNAQHAEALAQAVEGSEAPEALLAQLLLCERRLDPDCQRRKAAALVRAHPDHPASAIAALTLERLVGQSTVLDETLAADLTALLDAPAARALDAESHHRLRDALAALAVARGDQGRAQQIREADGLIQSFEIVGPLSAYHYLEFDTPLGPEASPAATRFRAPWDGEAGAQSFRPLRMNNGTIPIGHALDLQGNALDEGRGPSPTGDIVYLRTKVHAAGGALLLRLETTASVRLFLDGRPVLTSDAFRRIVPRIQWARVSANDGDHVLLVKAAVVSTDRTLRLSALPANAGPLPPAPDVLRGRFEESFGAALGPPLAARALLPRDPHAALAALAPAGAPRSGTAGLGVLGLMARAEVWRLLDTLSDEDAYGRMERDLDAWLEREPLSPAGHLRRSQELTDRSRYELAARDLDAIAVVAPDALVARARLLLQRDAGALSQAPIAEALARDPGHCQALDLALSSAEQAGDFRGALAFAHRAERCPGGEETWASWRARTEGPAPLVAFWRGRVSRSPSDPEAAQQLSEALVAQGDLPGAVAAMDTRLASWPDDGAALRRKANLEDLAGSAGPANGAVAPSPDAASATWHTVLAKDPTDLSLRRFLALTETGREPLEDLLPSMAETLAQPRWLGQDKAPTATLLDSGAALLHRDGSVTERVRTLEIPLEQGALSPLGELDLPAGAALVALRTHKADGVVLDAEAQSLGEKRTISAASLQVGDLLEIDYLMSSPPPRRGLGGAAEAFYFQAADSSLARSIYQVAAEPGETATVDSHRIDAPAKLSEAAPLRVERTHVVPLPAEPNCPPQDEFYPWVQVGNGNSEIELARSVADQLMDKTTVDEGVAQLAAVAPQAGGDQRRQAEALWISLSKQLNASGGTLADAASEIVGQGRGNLLLPMRAALRALRIASHVVLVSGPAQSAERRRFARLGEYGDILLRIEPRGEAPVWLAASEREAPFGQIPPNLCGQRGLVIPNGDTTESPATVLPTCGEQAFVSAPGPNGSSVRPTVDPNDHSLDLHLTLQPDGTAIGEGRETLRGFEATVLRSSLEDLDDEQRRQGVESSLASLFQGVELTRLGFDLGKEPGAPLTVSYTFRAPGFADPEGGGVWSLPVRGFPAQLSTRFAQLASRQLPLLISAGERPGLRLTLDLPEGAVILSETPQTVALQTTFGSFVRQETRAARSVRLEEKLVLPPQRVSPERYAEFAAFAAQVDEAQAERLRFRVP